MTSATTSTARIMWEGLRKRPALFPVVACLWIAGLGMSLGSAFILRKSGLGHIAFPLMNSAWMTGFMLLSYAQLLGNSSKWQAGAIERHRRGRLLRWLGSPDATFVDVSGTVRQRAQRAIEAKALAEQPDATIIAMPVLTGLGAACFGFAGAMVLAEAYAAPPSLVLYSPRAIPLFWGITLFLFLAGSLGVVGHATMRVYGWASQRAQAAAQAKADIERARLGALQAQMNPHFLFNTLNTVAALAGTDSPRAERVVEHLSAVLRRSLQRADQMFTSVEDELRFVRAYLDVEQERLGARLNVTWDVDAKTSGLRVPTMSLLPLVENAIAYAIETRPNGGHIHITSAMTAGGYLLRLSVEDDGPGFPAGMKDGRGLGELRQRLWAEYDRRYTLDTETVPTGARVTLRLPATPFKEQAVVNPEGARS